MNFLKKLFGPKTPKKPQIKSNFKILDDLDNLPNFKAGAEVRAMYKDGYEKEKYIKCKEKSRSTKYDAVIISVINKSDPYKLVFKYCEWKYNKINFSDEVYTTIKNKINEIDPNKYDLPELYKWISYNEIYLFQDVYNNVIYRIFELQEKTFIPELFKTTPPKASQFLNARKKEYKPFFSLKLDKAIEDLKTLEGYEALRKEKIKIAPNVSKNIKSGNVEKLEIYEKKMRDVNDRISELIKNYFN
ncbi:hypothetical protein FORMB_18730 [Formosa sp. Hel1_33_131]|uniref:hypothetical protein n=1 Tax=Formosa sp. Hel1_33_131 TaxID=1336794 RepID=UPI00084E11DF|nr:hypothetical protein [Formosa sp. Hel1_33_131]AOR28903.1 hypothetical protein FORMB_18730 [Formosa sp. Hel1_33_131]